MYLDVSRHDPVNDWNWNIWNAQWITAAFCDDDSQWFTTQGDSTASQVGVSKLPTAVKLSKPCSSTHCWLINLKKTSESLEIVYNVYIPLLISGQGGNGWFCREKGCTEYKSSQEMAPKCTTKWKSMEPKTAAHYKIQNWHHSKPGNMGLLQNRLEQIISLPGGVNVQKRLCMICSIQFNLFCRETFRNPCWIPGFFLPRFLS